MTSCDRLALQLALTHLRDADTDHGENGYEAIDHAVRVAAPCALDAAARALERAAGRALALADEARHEARDLSALERVVDDRTLALARERARRASVVASVVAGMEGARKAGTSHG